MPSEKQPKMVTLKRGGKTWKIDPDNVRAVEGVLHDDGIRRVYYTKDQNELETAAMISRFRARGYEYKATENGLEIEFSMPQKKWLEIEKAQHENALARQQSRKDATMTSDGITAGLERLGDMSVDEFAAIAD